MECPRRKFLQSAVAAAAAPAFSRVATAQAYPIHPVTMIVPGAAGGPTDVLGRLTAERMRRSLGQPIIVENVSGADGTVGTGRVARAKPDGYTIELGLISTHMLNGALYSLRYDVLNDFAPISPLVTLPYVLYARKSMPANDLGQLIVWLKANPNKASAGFGSSFVHLITVLFQKQTETKFGLVPYRGAAPVFQDLAAGQLDLSFATPDGLSLMQAGSLKAYAVTSDTRLALAPDTPTFAEMGLPAVSFSGWLGFFAPKGTPRDIVGKLNAAAVESLSDPTVQSRLAGLGMEIFPRERQTPEALAALQKADADKWWPIIKELRIKAE